MFQVWCYPGAGQPLGIAKAVLMGQPFARGRGLQLGALSSRRKTYVGQPSWLRTEKKQLKEGLFRFQAGQMCHTLMHPTPHQCPTASWSTCLGLADLILDKFASADAC